MILLIGGRLCSIVLWYPRIMRVTVWVTSSRSDAVRGNRHGQAIQLVWKLTGCRGCAGGVKKCRNSMKKIV